MVFNNNLLLGAAGQSGAFDTTLIERSAWFDGAADYMARQNGSAFTNTKEAIFSFWIKRCKFSTQQAFFGSVEGGNGFILQFTSADKLEVYAANATKKVSTQVFRDNAYYHIIVSFDTSQATATDRIKVWVNGEQITSWTTDTAMTLNGDIGGLVGAQTGAETMHIGNYNNTASNFYFWNGYVAQACMLESVSIQQGDYAVSDFLDTYTFGVNGSQYVPKADADIAALATAAGGNSFCLTTAIGDGTDASGNGNNFTPTSMSDAANGSSNTPSNSIAIWNPLDINNGGSFVVSEGGQTTSNASASQHGMAYASQAFTYKTYIEYEITDATNPFVGISDYSLGNPTAESVGNNTYSWSYFTGGNYIFHSGTNGGGIGLTVSNGDIFMMAFDPETYQLWFGVNGTWVGDPSAGTGATYTVDASNSYVAAISALDGGSVTTRFDPELWSYTAPTGFKGLRQQDKPTPDYQGADYFTVTLAQEANIEADVASAVADWSSNVTLYKNLAVAESWIHRFSSDASNEYLTGDDTSPTYQSTSTLTGTNNWVAFSFRTENQAYQETGISHTNGAVTTVTHNLGNADAMILLYNRSGTGNIFIYAPQLTAGNLLKLNTNAAEAVDTSIQNVLANSFDIGSTQATGTYDVFILLNGDVFGVTSYIGNGAVDGSFLPLSFKPQFMYLNRINSTSDAPFFDTTRDDTGNVTNDALFINLNDVEYPDISTYNQDFLSGGWKARTTNVSFNASSVKYFVLAVADIAGGGDLPPIYGR